MTTEAKSSEYSAASQSARQIEAGEFEQGIDQRIAVLRSQIDALPDTVSQVVALDPTRPEWRTTLSDLEKQGKGWKLHTNFDPNNYNSVVTVHDVLGRLQASNIITAYKVGEGGGTAAGAPGKEATVYVGNKDKTNVVAGFLSAELHGTLAAPEGDTLRDDIELAPGLMGRFEVYGPDQEFNQYGGKGFPVLQSEAGKVLFGDPASREERILAAQVVSLQRLEDKYGSYFTDSAELAQPNQLPVAPTS